MSYGIKLYDPSGQSVVFSEDIRTSNIQVSEGFTLIGPIDATGSFPCKDAQDSTKVLITFLESPTDRDSGILVYIQRETDAFKVKLYDNLQRPQEQQPWVTGQVLAIRIG